MPRLLGFLLFAAAPLAAHAQAAAPSATEPAVTAATSNPTATAATKSKVRRDRKGRLCTSKGMWPTSSEVNNSLSASDLDSGDDWHSGGASDASGSFQD